MRKPLPILTLLIIFFSLIHIHGATNLEGDHTVIEFGGENGNLTVEGQFGVHEEAYFDAVTYFDQWISIGSTDATVDFGGFLISYADKTTPVTTGEVGFSVSRPDGLFHFYENSASSDVELKMVLNESNQLILQAPNTTVLQYLSNPGANDRIVLDPDDTNPQILINGNAVLTEVSGVAPFLPSSLGIVAGSGTQSLVFGNYTSTTVGDYSYAFGDLSTAIGLKSVSFGNFSHASGNYSMAVGNNANALGGNSFAFGQRSYAYEGQFVIGRFAANSNSTSWADDNHPIFIIGNGNSVADYSTAFTVHKNGDTHISGRVTSGTSSVTGNYATAFGEGGTVIGHHSFAAGYFNVVNGDQSFAAGFQNTTSQAGAIALGVGTTASGYSSFASGGGTTAAGSYAFAGGASSRAYGDYSIAMGRSNISNAPNQMSIGKYNLPTAASSNVALMVGNGSSEAISSRANVFDVSLDGNVRALGVIKAAPGGDVSMGNFTTGDDPREDLDPHHLNWTP